MGLSLNLTSGDSHSAFQLGLRSQGLPNDKSISVSLLANSVLNYEVQNTYTLTLRVTDQAERSATQSIFVEVIDVNESPQSSELHQILRRNSTATYTVLFKSERTQKQITRWES